MPFFFYALLALLIAAADQLTKLLVVQNIPLHTTLPLLPGVVSLTYVQNDGAAFSSFRGMQWMFMLIFLIFTAAIFYEYFKKPMPFSKWERVLIAAVYGGGLGNLIDRVRLGYVVDMIQTEFMNFPVFNVADCFISCGCILLMLHLILCNRQIWKEDKK